MNMVIRPLILGVFTSGLLFACGVGATPAPKVAPMADEDPNARWNEGVEKWNALSQEERDAWHAKGDGFNGFKVWAAEHGYPTEAGG